MIYVDTREPVEIYEAMVFRKLPAQRIKLDVGDVCFDSIHFWGKLWRDSNGDLINIDIKDGTCIERKTVSDLYKSLSGDRLFTQAENMKENYDHAIVALIGDIPEPFNAEFAYIRKRILGTIAVLHKSFGIEVQRFENNEQFYDWVDILYNITMHPKKSSSGRPLRIKKKSRDPDVQAEDVLASFPGIGRKRAQIIMKNAGVLYFALTNPKDCVKPFLPKKTYEKYDNLLMRRYQKDAKRKTKNR